MTTASMPKSTAPGWGGAGRFCLAVLPVAAAGAIGSLATLPNIPGWYAGLAKPPMTPPNAAFGPAWTLLYVLMAIAFWRVLGRPGAGRSGTIAVFLGQLALNALWSVAFFGLHNPALALGVIAALLGAIAATMLRFSRVDRAAVWLLAPYLAWVSFAAYLNCGVWWLNG
jgi:tryptophan-rich sensory protein